MQRLLWNSRTFPVSAGIFLLLFSAMMPFPVAGTNDSPGRQVKERYDRVEFREAIALGNRLLAENRLSPGDLALVHQYLGFAHFNLGNIDSARVHFLSLLSLQPDIRFDPAETSPKIINFFNQLRAENLAAPPKETAAVFTRYVLVPDLRAGAAWRSAILPGWGQLHKGQKIRALLLGGVFWVGLAGTAAALQQESDTRNRYVNATDPAEITRRYDSYNRWFKTRRILTVTTAGLWLLNVLDASWSGYPRPAVTASRTGTLIFSLKLNF